MPVQINTLDAGIGIEFISSGVVTGKDIIGANNLIYTHENLCLLRYKIIDRTTCTDYNVTPEEIRTIANQDKAAAKINPNIIVALVSTTPYQYGMTRMWGAYIDGTGLQAGIFNDRKSADTWLKSKMRNSTNDINK